MAEVRPLAGLLRLTGSTAFREMCCAKTCTGNAARAGVGSFGARRDCAGRGLVDNGSNRLIVVAIALRSRAKEYPDRANAPWLCTRLSASVAE